MGGIYSSPIPPIEYPWTYHERVQEYDLEQANEAPLDLKQDRVRGSAVLRVAP